MYIHLESICLTPITYICNLLTCSISYLLYLLLDLWNANKISISISISLNVLLLIKCLPYTTAFIPQRQQVYLPLFNE